MTTFTERDIIEGGKRLAERFGEDWFQRIDLDKHSQGSEGICVADQLGGAGTWKDYSGYREHNGLDTIWNDPAADTLWQQHICDLRNAARRPDEALGTDDLTVVQIIEQLEDAKDSVRRLTRALADRLREIAEDYAITL